MLFNSYIFIFAFLPVTVAVYYLLRWWVPENARIVWLVAASLFFYGWWDYTYLPLICGVAIFNFLTASAILWHREVPSYARRF